MKSFFTKLGKLLLCGVAVAVVGSTDYDTDIQNVNERVDAVEADFEKAIADLQAELNANFATKAELAALETELNTTIAEEVAKLNAAIDTKADKAEVEAAIAALQKALADAKAELQGDIDENSEAIAGAIARIAALETTVNSLCEAVSQNTMGIQNLTTAFEVYQAEMEAQMDAVNAYIDTMEEEIYSSIQTVQEFASAINTLLAEEIERSSIEDAALWEKINMIEGVCTNLDNLLKLEAEERKAEDDNINKQLENLTAMISSVYTTLEEKIDNEVAQINQTLQTLSATVSTLSVLIDDVDAALKAHIAAFEAYKASVNEALKSLKAESELHTEAIQNLSGRLDAAEATIEDLQAMDQSLQAAIMELTTIAQNLSGRLDATDMAVEDLQAKLDEYVEGLLSQIASTQQALTMLNNLVQDINGNVEDLLERVQSLVYVPDYSDHKATIDWAMIASTNAMPAAAEDDALYTIVAKATDFKYLVKANAGEDAVTAAADIAANPSVLDYFVTDVKTRGASQSGADLEIAGVKAEGEYIIVSVVAKNFDAKFFENKRQGIYSAALALVDANGNNLTSEYTNLVPGEAAHIEMGLYLTEADDVMNVAGTEDTTKMPCNDSETVYTSLCPTIGFLIDDEKAMANLTSIQPYLTVEDLKALGYDMDVKYRLDLDKAISTSIPSGMVSSGNIFNKYFKVGNDRQANVNVSVVEGTPFSAKGQSIFAKYTATANGTTVTYVHNFVLSNAQVAVDMEANATWTIAIMDSLFEGKHYAKSYLIDSVAFKSVGGPVAHLTPVLNSPAEMLSTTFYVKDAQGEWVKADDRSFKLAKFNNNATVDIEMIGGTYSWNNSYKIVWESVNNNDNVDYTTTAIVNLVGKPESIDVTIPVDFKLVGKNAFFSADADLLGESFKALDQYLEYGDSAADKAKWTSVFNSLVARYTNKEIGYPVVNGKATNRTSILNELAQARLYIGYNDIYEDKANVITFSVTPWWDVPVNFTVTGNVQIPEYEFIYSEDYVKNATATVYGQIEEGEYNIIQSDLAKYFNVDAESLNGHEYTVEFEVVAPEATEDEYVTVGPETVTPVIEKGAATYNYLEQDNVVLDWATYRGLQVNVNATLKINGMVRETLPLTLVTEDPLKLTGTAEYTVDRELRKNLDVKVFEKLVLTSSAENYANLLTTDKKAVNKTASNVAADLDAAQAYAASVYGVDLKVVLGEKGVYYYDNSGNLIILGTNKYNYEASTGILTIYGDDAQVKNYYADFTAVMTSRICGGEHQVPFRVIATLKK